MSLTKRLVAAGGGLTLGAALVLTGCSSGTGESELESGTPADGDTAEAGEPVTIGLCNAVSNGVFDFLAEEFNAQTTTGITLSATELGTTTDESRTQMIQRLEGGSKDCDIYMMDGPWLGEWANQGWVLPADDLVAEVGGDMFESVLATSKYDGTYWNVPFYTNAGLLYYRSDRVEEPTSWVDLYATAATSKENQALQQLMQYEGLTVNFLEILYSNGGEVLDAEDNVAIDSPETREVLQAMVDAMADGAIDRASLTYEEASSRMAFESGAGAYLRGWPSAYVGIVETEIADNVVPIKLPPFKEGQQATPVFGGWSMGISSSSEHPEEAAEVIRYAVSEEFQKKMFLGYNQAPVVPAAYDSPDVLEAFPLAKEVKESVEAARPRPISPVYAQLSRAIYDNVYEALQGNLSVDDAVTKMASEIEAAQETF